MAEGATQKLGIEFTSNIKQGFGDEVIAILKKIQEQADALGNTKIGALTENFRAMFANIGGASGATKVIQDLSAALSVLGQQASTATGGVTEAAQKMIGAFAKGAGGGGQGVKDVVSEWLKLEESLNKINLTAEISGNSLRAYEDTWKRISKSVDIYISELSKVADTERNLIQQRASNISFGIDELFKRLKAPTQGEDTGAIVSKITQSIKALRQTGIQGVDLEYHAINTELASMGVTANMTKEQIDKLGLGLLESGKVTSLLQQSIARVKEEYGLLDKESSNYKSDSAMLNKELQGLTTTLDIVSAYSKKVSVSNQEVSQSAQKASEAITGLRAQFSALNMNETIDPKGVANMAQSWNLAKSALDQYIQQLSQLKPMAPEAHQAGILNITTELDAQMSKLSGMRASGTWSAESAEVKILVADIDRLIKTYSELMTVNLQSTIDATVASLEKQGITAGMTYGNIRKLKQGTLDLSFVNEQVKSLLSELEAMHKRLATATNVDADAIARINKMSDAYLQTLGAVETKMRVTKGVAGDAARQMRQYAEGFIPMIKSQAAWLVGGALLFGTMFKIQEAAKNFIAFEDRLNRMRIIGEGTTQQMSVLREQLLGLAEESGQLPAALAEASFYLVKFGLTVEQVNEALPALTRLTTVAGGTIQENAKGVITIMNAFKMSFDKTAQVADAMNMALNRSALEMADLSSITSTVASSAAQFNQPIEQILAFAAALSNLGVVPSTIGTSLRQLLGTLAQVEAPTQKFIDNILIKMTKALGSHKAVVDALNPSYHSLIEILGTMGKAGLTAANVYQGLNIRTAAGVLAMLNAKDSLKSLSDEIEASSILTSQYAQTLKSAETSLKQLSATLESTIMKILGAGAEKGIANLIKVISGLLQVIGWLNTGFIGMVIHITGLSLGILTLINSYKALSGVLGTVTTVIGLSGWLSWVVAIFAVISALNLLVQALSRYNISTDENNKALLTSINNRNNEIKEIRAQILANEQLVTAKLLERSEAKKLTDILKEQLGIKEKLRELDLQAIRQSMFEDAKKKITEALGTTGHYGGKSTIGGNLPATMVPAFAQMPFLSNEKDAQKWATNNQEAFKKVIDAIQAMDEVSRKVFFKTPGMAWIEWLDQYYKDVLKAKKALEPQSEEDKKADVEHKRKMSDLQIEQDAIVKKNAAIMESQRIQEDIYIQDKKIAELEKQKQTWAVQNDKKEQYKIEEMIGAEESKRLELTYKLEEAKRKEKIANDEYVTSMFKLGIEAEIINKHLERRGRLEYELAGLQLVSGQAKTELQNLEMTDNAQQSEKDAARAKYLTAQNAVLQKQKEITQEGFAEIERSYTLQENASARLLEAKLLEIEQSKTLTDRQKEEQKLLLQRADLQERILNLGKQLALSNTVGGSVIDAPKQEAMLKQLEDLSKDLGLTDLRYKHLQETQKTFWDGLAEYIRQTSGKLETFWYDMGLEFSNTVEGMIADWGKFVVYQGAASAKEAKKSADKQTSDLKASYDEQKADLENKFATGQVTSAQYYQQLTDMNKKYNKDIGKAQDDYNTKMRESQDILGNLWKKFWHKMVDLAIEALAKMAMQKMQLDKLSGGMGNWLSALGSGGGSPTGVSTGAGNGVASMAHSGGLMSDVIAGIKFFHSGGLNSNEVYAKLLKDEFVMRPKAVRDIGVGNLYNMNRTGQMPSNNIRVYNLMDAASIPTLGPNDVLNIVSFDMARRGQLYKTLATTR